MCDQLNVPRSPEVSEPGGLVEGNGALVTDLLGPRRLAPSYPAQWCQHVEKVWGPENTSKHPNLSEVCFLALFLWL